MRALLVAAASLLVTVPAAPAAFDHLVVGVRSLDVGVAQFEQLTGVRAVIGGKHPGRGTENALVSLGSGSYLEIIAPQPGATLSAEDNRMRRLDRLTVIDWAVHVPDVDGAAAALRRAGLSTGPPQPGARLTPSGERLEWTTFGVGDPPIGGAPFFIHWSANTRHPSTTAPGGCAIEHFVVRDPSAERLRAALKALDVETVRVQAGTPRIEAALRCGSTPVILTSG
jgi:hypothetical protein